MAIRGIMANFARIQFAFAWATALHRRQLPNLGLPSPYMEEKENVQTPRGLRAYLLAARPKTLTGALIPVIVGSALAYGDGCWDATAALLCALFACGMQVAANYINDLYDGLRGSDRPDRLGPKRACAEGWVTPRAMRQAIGASVAVSCAVGLGLLAHVRERMPFGGWELVALGALCVAFAYLYTTFFSCRGWGDVLVLVFFGFVPVGGTYYVQAATLTADVAAGALACGLVVDTLLTLNNYRDREQDRQSGKLTLVLRLGGEAGRWLYLGLGVAGALVSLWFVVAGRVTLMELIWAPGVYLYLHAVTSIKLWRAKTAREYNKALGQTSRNMLFFALLLAAALL